MANTTTAWRYIPSRSFLVHFKPSFLSTYWLKDKKWKLKDIRYKLKINNNATKMKRTVRKRSTLMPFHHCHKSVFRPKMAIFQRAGMREGGLPFPLAFDYLIFMIWRACDLNLVMISLLASKWQDFKLRGLQFHFINQLKNDHPNFKDLIFWNQERHHDQILITSSSYHKNQILKR